MNRAIGFAATLAALVVPGLARADAIDGHWCWQTRHMQIQGPTIVTPGGKQTTGNYARHTFSYVVPVPEPDAGQTIDMTLINEDIVHLRIGAQHAGEPQVWRRCAAPST
jgi:hypothetical protein